MSRLDMLEGAKSIGAGAATIALAGAAVGIGNVLSSSIHSVARNPSLAKQSFGYAILGFALTEDLGRKTNRHLDVIQPFPFSLGKNGEVHPNPPMKK